MRIDIDKLPPAMQRQIADKIGKLEAEKKTKYHNHPTERTMPNGTTHRFPSEKEARRYDELALLHKAGEIRNLKIQPQFTITEGFITAEGETVRPHRYTADFSYYKKIGMYWEEIVEDVKGGKATQTREYINNKKALAEKGIFVKEV